MTRPTTPIVPADAQLARYTAALRQLAAKSYRIPISATAFDWWTLCSAVQLACRHPEFTGPTRVRAERLARQIFSQLAPDGPLRDLAALGWDPAHDEPPDGQEPPA